MTRCDNTTVSRLYVDATLAHPAWDLLPTRGRAVAQFRALVTRVLDCSFTNIVLLLEACWLGTEELVQCLLAHASVQWVGVADERRFLQLNLLLSQSRGAGKLMLLGEDVDGGILQSCRVSIGRCVHKNVLGLRSVVSVCGSSLWWASPEASDVPKGTVLVESAPGRWRLKWAMHSTFSELGALVTALRPRELTPICEVAMVPDQMLAETVGRLMALVQPQPAVVAVNGAEVVDLVSSSSLVVSSPVSPHSYSSGEDFLLVRYASKRTKRSA